MQILTVQPRRRPARGRLLALAAHRALRGPPRPAGRAQRDAARRLAETPRSYLAATLLVEVLRARPEAPATADRAARGALPRRLPVREAAAVVRAARWRTAGARCRSTPRSAGRFRTITNHTTYSFGIDDQEFMTAFECEEPESTSSHLMMTLRETEASRYTERDTPIFVGVAEDIRAILDSLDGARARVERPRCQRGRISSGRSTRSPTRPARASAGRSSGSRSAAGSTGDCAR